VKSNEGVSAGFAHALHHRLVMNTNRELSVSPRLLPFPDGRPALSLVRTAGVTSLRSAFRVAFHVPTTANNGSRFTDDSFAALETHLEAVAGGWHRSHDVDGGWRSPDETVWRETCRRYVTTVDENSIERVATAIEAYVKDTFDQEAVYLEVASVLTSVF
jgi:hypothetical protein